MVTHKKHKYLQPRTQKHQETTLQPQPPQKSHNKKMMQERYGYGGGGAPSQQGLLLMVVVGVVVLGPYIIGEQGQAMLDSVIELLSPASLLIFTVVLLLTIQFISSNRRAHFSPGCYPPYGEPDPFDRYFGGSPSPVGVALVLILVLFLLQNKISLFGGGEEGGDDE